MSNNVIDPYDIRMNGGVDNGTRFAIKTILKKGEFYSRGDAREVGVFYLQQLDIVSSKLRAEIQRVDELRNKL